MTDRHESALEMAHRHVIEGTARVEAQEEIVANLTALGVDTGTATSLLDTFQKVLAQMRADLARQRLLARLSAQAAFPRPREAGSGAPAAWSAPGSRPSPRGPSKR
jgi:hypothetical protein